MFFVSARVFFRALFVLAFFASCQKADIAVIRIQPTLPETSKVIAVLGSSTAEGIGANPLDQSWVNKLKGQLSADFKKATVINLAMRGYTTYKVLPSAYGTADTVRNVDKALSYKPHLVVISLPSNDVASGVTDQETLNNYAVITQAIKARGIPFLIVSTLPRNFPPFHARQRLALFNDKLQAAYPGHIVHVYQKFATPDYNINPVYAFGDGVHINNAGHEVVYKAVLQDSLFKASIY